MNKGEARFKKLGIITIIAVYLLILVGGIVRSTGSGMGCPDWPKCFGSWVPPTSVEELPSNYQEIYSGKRAAKNEKLSGYLDFLGFSETANKLRNDEAILIEAEFNSTKTWIEYFNRLLGAIIGLMIIATFISSLVYIKKDRSIPLLAFASLILVIFQGWIGSIVVSTNLLPWMITIHMLLAFLLLGLLIYTVYKAYPTIQVFAGFKQLRTAKILLVLCLVTLIAQVVVGTQVREAIDVIAGSFNFEQRSLWIGELDFSFYFHRSFSLVVLGLHIWLLVIVRRQFQKESAIGRLGYWLLVLVVLEILSGIGMAYFAIPAFLQPVHLAVSSLIFGVQYILWLIFAEQRVSSKAVNSPEVAVA